MKENSVIAIDLAKNVFQACVLNQYFKPIKNVKLSRTKLLPFVLQHKPKEVTMESCYSANYWGRVFEQHDIRVKLIPAQHVKPFVRGNKNDKNDVIAIAEASQRPNIKFVSVKSIEQQDMQSLHRIRERLLSDRLRLSNQVRGLLSEYGVTMNQGHHAFRVQLLELIDQDNALVGHMFKQALSQLYEEYQQYQERLQSITRQIKKVAEHDELHQLLMSVPGIGPIIATAIISTIGDGRQFSTANEFAVWLGLTPRQHASGDKSYQLGITKRGDRYLRKQLVHGARAATRWCRKRDDSLSRWTNELIGRRGYNKATVALAHKLARIVWAVLRDRKPFKANA
jgi:transposase